MLETDLLSGFENRKTIRPPLAIVVPLLFNVALFTLMYSQFSNWKLVDYFADEHALYDFWIPVMVSILASMLFFFGFKLGWILIQVSCTFYLIVGTAVILFKFYENGVVQNNRAPSFFAAYFISSAIVFLSLLPQLRDFFKLKAWHKLIAYLLGMGFASLILSQIFG